METVKYLKTLKGARVAPGGFGFRTLSSTYISNKKNYTPQSKVQLCRCRTINYDVIDYAKVGDMYERYMLELPFAKWKSLRMTNNDALDIKMQMSVPDFIGFLQSDHAWQMYLDANPHTDHLARIEDRLRDAYKDSTGNETSLMNITWKVLLLMGRKPIE